uniref:Protein kinase domain-containing protein n=1 Tax=Caenorhabditis tropicalis TaxID=1561998 RepID=A0A1I7UJD1_9PELO
MNSHSVYTAQTSATSMMAQPSTSSVGPAPGSLAMQGHRSVFGSASARSAYSSSALPSTSGSSLPPPSIRFGVAPSTSARVFNAMNQQSTSMAAPAPQSIMAPPATRFLAAPSGSAPTRQYVAYPPAPATSVTAPARSDYPPVPAVSSMTAPAPQSSVRLQVPASTSAAVRPVIRVHVPHTVHSAHPKPSGRGDPRLPASSAAPSGHPLPPVRFPVGVSGVRRESAQVIGSRVSFNKQKELVLRMRAEQGTNGSSAVLLQQQQSQMSSVGVQRGGGARRQAISGLKQPQVQQNPAHQGSALPQLGPQIQPFPQEIPAPSVYGQYDVQLSSQGIPQVPSANGAPSGSQEPMVKAEPAQKPKAPRQPIKKVDKKAPMKAARKTKEDGIVPAPKSKKTEPETIDKDLQMAMEKKEEEKEQERLAAELEAKRLARKRRRQAKEDTEYGLALFGIKRCPREDHESCVHGPEDFQGVSYY